MEKYAIYSYKLKEKPFRNFDFSMPGEPCINRLSPEKRFTLLFGKERGAEVEVKKVKKNGNVNHYPCKVLTHDADIVLLRLVNDRDVNLWEEEESTTNPVPKIEKTKRPTKPYCFIFIDTRPESRIIAIQSGTAAWRNTAEAKELLQESLNHLLDINDYGLEITIMSKMMPSNFWDYVNKRRRKEKVQIKSMTFSFANHKRRSDIDISTALSSEWKHLESFIGWMDRLGGDKGEIKILPPKNAELIGRKVNDIKHMIEICANSNYTLSVTFSDDITYKCNQELRAELPMKEEIREDFDKGQHDLFHRYDIIDWIDDARHKTDEYNEVEEIRRKAGRKSRAQVS